MVSAPLMRHRRYFVKCNVDGFIDWSKPYGQFARALIEAERLDTERHWCGPHTVTAEEWSPEEAAP